MNDGIGAVGASLAAPVSIDKDGQPLDLAPVGNGIIAGLFDRHGRCSWLCWPRFDGDPIFSSLLGGVEPEQGFMECELIGLTKSTQRYRRNTAVLETELEDANGGRLRIIDAAPRRASSAMAAISARQCWCGGSSRSRASR